MCDSTMKANLKLKCFKRKPKPIPNAKRLKILSSDEKPDGGDRSFESKSVSDNLDSVPNSVLDAPLIERVPDLNAVCGKQFIPHDSFNDTSDYCSVSSTTSANISKDTAICVTSNNTIISADSFLSCSSVTSSTESTPVSVNVSPVTETCETTVSPVSAPSLTASAAQSSISLTSETKLFTPEMNYSNLDSLEEKYNAETVKEKKSVISFGDVTDKNFMKKYFESQRLIQILSHLNSKPLIKVTVVKVDTDGIKAVALSQSSKPDNKSVLSPTSYDNKILDRSAKVENAPAVSDVKENNLISSKVSADLHQNSLSSKKKPNLSELKSKAYDEHGNLTKNQLTLRDFIYFNPPHNPIRKNVIVSAPKSCDIDRDSDSDSSESDYASAVPLVKVSGDGKVIVDPESINIRPFDKKLKKMKKRTVIKEDEYSSRLKIMNHIRKQKKDTISSLFSFDESQKQCSKFWTLEETLKFYKVLNEFGSDFSIMLEAFPYRTRKQLKRKFLAEEKKRIRYIDLAMTKPDSIDFKALEEELKQSQRKKSDDKEKQKLLAIEKEKEFERRMRVEYEPLVKRRKVVLNSEIRFENGVNRVSRKYSAKENVMRRHVKRMKLKYLEEKSQESENFENNFKNCQHDKSDISYKKEGKSNHIKSKVKEDRGKKSDKHCKKKRINGGIKESSDSETDVESLRFDIGNPVYRNKLFLEQQNLVQAFVEDSFIEDIEDEDDLDLFFSISSKMNPHLGLGWKTWVINKTINLLSKKKIDCGAKKAAIKMKTELEKKEIEKKLKFVKMKEIEKMEECYQLFAEPFDYTDPFEKYINDNL